MSRTLKLTLQYDGTAYVGWQRQANGVSIQGLLEEALATIEGATVTCSGAGRTDAGVHALGQVASCAIEHSIDEITLLRALNAILPGDVRVVAVERVTPDFHARFGAVSKTYTYWIRNAPVSNVFNRVYSWHVPQLLDHAAMRSASEALAGRHDFAGFQSSGSDATSTVRTILGTDWHLASSDPIRVPPFSREGLIGFEITGDGFLRHMVRAIVGTLVEIGLGRRPPEAMKAILDGRDRGLAGPTAPAHGLFLVRVDY